MAIRPEEITSILQQELQGYENKYATDKVGTVIQPAHSLPLVVL